MTPNLDQIPENTLSKKNLNAGAQNLVNLSRKDVQVASASCYDCRWPLINSLQFLFPNKDQGEAISSKSSVTNNNTYISHAHEKGDGKRSFNNNGIPMPSIDDSEMLGEDEVDIDRISPLRRRGSNSSLQIQQQQQQQQQQHSIEPTSIVSENYFESSYSRDIGCKFWMSTGLSPHTLIFDLSSKWNVNHIKLKGTGFGNIVVCLGDIHLGQKYEMKLGKQGANNFQQSTRVSSIDLSSELSEDKDVGGVTTSRVIFTIHTNSSSDFITISEILIQAIEADVDEAD